MKTRIVLAEDDDSMRSIIKTILEIGGYDVQAYPNGLMALEAYESDQPQMIVSDLNMPLLDGFGLLDGVRQKPGGQGLPFLFLSARSEKEFVNQARVLGADDYLFKPFEPDELLTAVKARLDRRRAIEQFDTRQAHMQTILMIANVVEARDAYTGGHVERVQRLAMELGKALHWSDEEMIVLEYGSLLHDIGKLSVPEAVLNKPGKLTDEEFLIMQSHTTSGARILEKITHLREAIPYVLYHHEKWNGKGYPEGRRGQDIPRQGRLMAVVDVYDALVSDRPYHKGMTPEAVLDIIRKDSGTHFDPDMAEVFIKMQSEKLAKSK